MTQPQTEAGVPKRPFRRPARHTNTKDEVGKVRVQVTLLGRYGQSHAKGNIVRSFTVLRSTVATVANRIERALYDDDAE